jgi:four helix bundle protein
MLNLNHKKLDVWKLSFDLIKKVYKLTNVFPNDEKYVLVSQLRRASISVISNIAEGSSRNSAIERQRFFEISRSSLIEIDTQLEVAKNLGYIDSEQSELNELLNHLFAKLTNLINNT